MKKPFTIFLLSLLAIALGQAVKPNPVKAGETCNYINNNLFMAQAHRNQNNVWVAEGWWKIEPGDCVVYADNASTYFKIEEEVSAPRPKIPQTLVTELCVVNDRFIVYQANDWSVCEGQDGQMMTFVGLGNQRELLKESNQKD